MSDILTLERSIADRVEAALRAQWVTAERWCEMTGDTIDAIYGRRKRGDWIDGVHSNKPRGGGLWVNTIAAMDWAAKPYVRSVSPRASASGATDLAIRSDCASPSCSVGPSAANDSR